MCTPTQPKEGEFSDRTKSQLDYAWKWFSYHADQRLKMFNYMLVVMALFANAIVASYGHKLSNYITIGLCVVAAIVAFFFSRLDYRNQQLVWLGEDVLAHLERERVFERATTRGRTIFSKNYGADADFQLGILARQKAEDSAQTSIFAKVWSGKHRYLLRTISYVIAAMFILLGFCLWLQSRS